MRKKSNPIPTVRGRQMAVRQGKNVLPPPETLRLVVEELAGIVGDLIRWPDPVPQGSTMAIDITHGLFGTELVLEWYFREGGKTKLEQLTQVHGPTEADALLNLASQLFYFVEAVNVGAMLKPTEGNAEQRATLKALVDHARSLSWQLHRSGYALFGSIGHVRMKYRALKFLKDTFKKKQEQKQVRLRSTRKLPRKDRLQPCWSERIFDPMSSPKTNEEKVLAQIEKAYQSTRAGKLQVYQITWSYIVNMLPKVPRGSVGVSIGRLLRAGAIKAHEKMGMSTYYSPTGTGYTAPGKGCRSDLSTKKAPKAKPSPKTPPAPPKKTTRKKAP